MTVFALFISACAGSGYYRRLHPCNCARWAQIFVECSDENSLTKKRYPPRVLTPLRTLRHRLESFRYEFVTPLPKTANTRIDVLIYRQDNRVKVV
jgi:hypothetical protein